MTNFEVQLSLQEQEKFLQTTTNSEDFDEDTRCGLGFIKGRWLQKIASKKSFIVLHSFTMMMYHASFSFVNGTFTTLEKHYKFSSVQLNYMYCPYDIVATFVALFVPYYCSRGRLPRWMGFAVFLLGFAYLISVLPYFLYGAGDAALSLTEEYGDTFNPNTTNELMFAKKMKELCYENKTADDCNKEEDDHSHMITVLFVISAAIEGFGGAIYNALGPVYIDDNCQKAKVPMLLCLSSFIKLLAPAIGYSLASMCLKIFIDPSLHPRVSDKDPRWIGAWWIGKLFFALVLLFFAPILATFPKTLPRAALRKKEELMKKLKKMKNLRKATNSDVMTNDEDPKVSIADFVRTFKRIIHNKIYFCNTMAGLFYVFGYIPFFFFQAKYIQVHFLFTPSTANLITGTVSLVFTAIGLLTAGIVITIFKPPARYLAMWNVVSSVLSVLGLAAYGYFSCTASINNSIIENSQNFSACNSNCNCDVAKFFPICGDDNVTYISACHAGCSDEISFENDTRIFTNCSCVNRTSGTFSGGSATDGACEVDCMPKFFMFLIFLCINHFINGTEGTANFLVGIRAIEKRDKAMSIGISMAIISFFAVVPGPLLFGWIMDESCLFWGKTCSKKGNCWLYDTDKMRYTLNLTAAGFILIGTLWDIGTWYYSKDVQIFDEDENEQDDTTEATAASIKMNQIAL